MMEIPQSLKEEVKKLNLLYCREIDNVKAKE